MMMKMLEGKGIPTHLVEQIDDRNTVVKKVEIVPLEVIIRNVAAGSFSKRYFCSIPRARFPETARIGRNFVRKHYLPFKSAEFEFEVYQIDIELLEKRFHCFVDGKRHIFNGFYFLCGSEIERNRRLRDIDDFKDKKVTFRQHA